MFELQRIRARLEEVSISEMDLEPSMARDVAFHMTDWLDDLSAYAEFCRNPEALSGEELSNMLLGFLLHVPNHIAAAAKLYADAPVQDIFGVGAIRSPGDAGA